MGRTAESISANMVESYFKLSGDKDYLLSDFSRIVHNEKRKRSLGDLTNSSARGVPISVTRQTRTYYAGQIFVWIC